MKNKSRIWFVIAIAIILVAVPLINIAGYYEHINAELYYKFDERTDLQIQDLIDETNRGFSDLWFQNYLYNQTADILLEDSEYIDMFSWDEEPTLCEFLMKDLSEYDLNQNIIDSLSGNLVCLKKSEALHFLLEGARECEFLGRIRVKKFAPPRSDYYVDEIISIDIVLFDNTVYAVIKSYYGLYSIYRTDISADITEKAEFIPFGKLKEDIRLTSFNTYVVSTVPFVYSRWGAFAFEYVVAFALAGIGFACGIKYKKDRVTDQKKK